MRFRPSLMAAICLGGIVVVAACTTDYQQGKGDPSFGGPNALAGQGPPGSTTDVTDDAGAGPGGGTVGSTPKCVAAGGTLADAGTCAVSFKNDILSAFGLANCGTTDCHGGALPRNQPRIEPSDAPGMWQEFQAFTPTTGADRPYINPCSTDETKSALACNLIADGQPGECGIHMPSGAQMPADAVAKALTWVKCGAPNN
jgi:hypothetical protein